MKPIRPRAMPNPKSRLEFYHHDFRPKEVEQSIAHLREENEKLRWMAAVLERQTRVMRASTEKLKSR